jgi:hypothetical protein
LGIYNNKFATPHGKHKTHLKFLNYCCVNF